MAVSNNDMVGKALESLNSGLRPFVSREMQAEYGSRANEEAQATLRRIEGRLLTGAEDGQWDTQAMLVMMWERWNDVFRKSLGHTERSLVSELREVRNNWAHQRIFSTEDTYRALDSISRLLRAISSDKAEEVEKQKQEVLRIQYEEQTGTEQSKYVGIAIKPSTASASKQEEHSADINRAADLLDPGESAIALFTKGLRLVEINSDGSGSSGNWVTNPGHHETPNKVIIYDRVLGRIPLESHIYLGDYVGAANSPERGRLVIRFQNLTQVGTTNQNWSHFADAGANPVRYLSKRK
jgi:hypothetical protein